MGWGWRWLFTKNQLMNLRISIYTLQSSTLLRYIVVKSGSAIFPVSFRVRVKTRVWKQCAGRWCFCGLLPETLWTWLCLFSHTWAHPLNGLVSPLEVDACHSETHRPPCLSASLSESFCTCFLWLARDPDWPIICFFCGRRLQVLFTRVLIT